MNRRRVPHQLSPYSRSSIEPYRTGREQLAPYTMDTDWCGSNLVMAHDVGRTSTVTVVEAIQDCE